MNARVSERREDGSFIIEGFATDITERKLAEEHLRETEKQYRELAESLPQVIFEIDLNGTLKYLNQTGFHLFGYRFWADGEWYNDPRNTLRCPNCFDSENNIIEVLL